MKAIKDLLDHRIDPKLRAAMRRATVPLEHDIQAALIARVRAMPHRYPELQLLHAIPNGGSRSKGEAGKMKAEGQLASIPDLFLPLARGNFHGLYLETKRPGEHQRKDQRETAGKLQANGFAVRVYRSIEEGLEILLQYRLLGSSAIAPLPLFDP